MRGAFYCNQLNLQPLGRSAKEGLGPQNWVRMCVISTDEVKWGQLRAEEDITKGQFLHNKLCLIVANSVHIHLSVGTDCGKLILRAWCLCKDVYVESCNVVSKERKRAGLGL